jgi:structural maintenance of chromosome 2
VRSRLSQLDFNYTPPPNFDARKVKGLVASLLALKPEDHGKSTALEIAAGGKLYNVVVEDERVGKDLLERGGIKKRVTLIPLNKIRAFKISAEVCVATPIPDDYAPIHSLLETTKCEPPGTRQSTACALTRRLHRRSGRSDRLRIQRHANLR